MAARLVTFAVTCLAATGCGAQPDQPDASTGTAHTGDHGPLSASTLPGRKALLAPPGRTGWQASFGTPLLCTTKPGTTIVLTGVRYDADPAPQHITTTIRTVPDNAADQPGDPISWAPFPGLLGRPGHFAHWTMHGTYSPLPSTKITRTCGSHNRGFTELVTTMKVPTTGAWIRHTYLDYTAAGHRYTLTIDWEMVGCGTRTSAACT